MSECKLFDDKKFAEMNCYGRKIKCRREVYVRKVCKIFIAKPEGLELAET
jgi:hypothetical protein